jgi:hypothetical protein
MRTGLAVTDANRPRALVAAGAAWIAIALAGQAIFATYVQVFYGGAVVRGDLAAWNQVFPRGYAHGDVFGNLLVASHVMFTVLLVLAGAVQLMPAVRHRAPWLHRIGGRFFVSGAAVIALGGLGMMLHRGAVGDSAQHLALAINGLVILVCAAQAWRHARARRFSQHRAWAFGQYVGPLALLEIWLRTERHATPVLASAVAGLFAALSLVTLAGIGAASLLLWLPRL